VVNFRILFFQGAIRVDYKDSIERVGTWSCRVGLTFDLYAGKRVEMEFNGR